MSQESEILEKAGRLIQAGGFLEAKHLLTAFVQTQKQHANAWFLLGAARHGLGDAGGALAAFDEACRIAPDYLQAFNASASVLYELGRFEEAASAYQTLLHKHPENPQLRTNLGIVLERLGRQADALKAYELALDQAPGFAAALNNRAAVLSALGRWEEALAAYDELAQTHPGNPDYHFNRAELLHGAGRLDESLAATDAALRLDPRHVNALIQKALNLSVLGCFDDAKLQLARARDIDPERFRKFRNPYDSVFGDNDKGLDPRLVYLEYLYTQQTFCDWSRHDEYLRNFEGLIAAANGRPDEIRDPRLPFRSLSFPMRDEVRKGLAVGIARAVSEYAAVPSGRNPASTQAGGQGRIRIGYVSPDYRVHPAAFLMQPVFELHDRARFEIYGYSLMKDDGSEIRRKIEGSVDAFRDVSGETDADIADRIASDRIDVLVDLAGYTNYSRAGVFARRPAPLQISYLGFPGTLGAEFIDYAVVDRVVCPPGAERHWTEKLVFLPNCYFVASNRDRATIRQVSRASTGLPASALVLCCFNNTHKIEPIMFSIWMRTLCAVPEAVLWLFAVDVRVQNNLRREARLRGVDPGRLYFAPYWTHERHLGRLAHADLMVDTLYYNAHTTAVDALGVGVPVLTCPGTSMPARVASSLLKAIGMPELVARDLAEYEQRLLYLAKNRAELQALKLKLKANYAATPLFDTKAFVRHLESAMETMVQRHRSGLPAESFDV